MFRGSGQDSEDRQRLLSQSSLQNFGMCDRFNYIELLRICITNAGGILMEKEAKRLMEEKDNIQRLDKSDALDILDRTIDFIA